MRPWIEAIYYNAAAHVDFIKNVDEIEKELKKRMYDLLTEGKSSEATLVASELKVYKAFMAAFKKETKELQNQAEKEMKNDRFNY